MTRPGDRLFLARVLLPFSAGYFLSYLFRTVNAVIGPELVGEIGLNAAGLGLLTSAYFLTFAAAQLPLGILLDRFGPRRVEAFLLVVAALGALVFALSDGLTGLTVARGLIGLGVSACLMASFKANALWFGRDRLPLVNGVILASGGFGALAATAPVEAALSITDWRGVFFGLSAVTLLVAGLILFTVPERQGGASPRLRDQLAGTVEVFRSRVFWRLAPVATVHQASFLAILGLWAGNWLRDVGGFDRTQAAARLSSIAMAMILGYLAGGAIAARLARIGIATAQIAVGGMFLFALVLLGLTIGPVWLATVLWFLFGFLGTTGALPYAVLSQAFPLELAGRVNTALNLLVFVGAFIAQWGLGIIIGLWPNPAGGYQQEGYQLAFMIVLLLELAALAWYLLPRRVSSGT